MNRDFLSQLLTINDLVAITLRLLVADRLTVGNFLIA